MILNEIFASQQVGFPILSVLLFLPLIVVVVLNFIRDDHLAYQVGLAGALIELLLAGVMAFVFIPEIPDMQFIERGFRIPYLGVGYHLGVDGVSLLFVPVTALLTLMVILYAEYAVKSDARHYAMATLALEATLIGAFVSLDMVLFWIFFVLELVPSYFLITRWGTGARRQQAAREYVLFMSIGSALMLAGIALLGINFHNASLASGQLVEQGFFDVVPGLDPAEFAGTWSNYRFPDSGITVVSTIENEANGLFVLKPTGTAVPSGDTPLPPASSTPTTPPGAPGGQPGSTGGADGGDGGSGAPTGGSDGPCSNEIVGSKRSDKLNGTSGSDKLAGRGGRDRLKGGRGNDCLRGGGGKDRLNGGDGADEIKPGRGKDRIKGGAGDDEIRAARGGRDRVNCGRGDDVAFVNDRKDRVSRNCERVKAR